MAQDSTKIFIVSSAGIIIPTGGFENAYKKSLALNSGLEYRLKKGFFLLGKFDFNAVKYNQQIIDNNSKFLFQNTSSTILQIGLNIGKEISLSSTKIWRLSPYLGIGYINIGEPRLDVDNSKNIITLKTARMQNIFGRVGVRFMKSSKAPKKPSLFCDFSYWNSPIEIQKHKAMALNLQFGTRIAF